MEINIAAFIKKHQKMNELDKKTCIRAVSTFLKAIQIFQKFYVAWTLCNLISEIRLTSMIRKG